MPSNSSARKRRDRRKRLRQLRPCPPADQGVGPPPHSQICLFDWANANHIDIGQLRKAIKRGQLPPGRTLGAIQQAILPIGLGQAPRQACNERMSAQCLVWSTLLAACQAELAAWNAVLNPLVDLARDGNKEAIQLLKAAIRA